MNCTKCGLNSNILETRLLSDGSIRRRRECDACGHRFTTYEAERDTTLARVAAKLREIGFTPKAVNDITKASNEANGQAKAGDGSHQEQNQSRSGRSTNQADAGSA